MSASSKKKLRKEQNAAAMTEKQQNAAKEAKKLKAYTLTFIIVMVLVVATVLGVALRTPIAGAIDRNTHAVTIGNHKLSTTDLSYFYVDAIDTYYTDIYNQYYSSYGSYWSMFVPFNTAAPLNSQVKDTTSGETWADYFMESALENAQRVYAMYDQATAESYQMKEDEQTSMQNYLDNLETYATKYYGYSSTDSYLRNIYGDGANVKTYTEYYTANSIASSYITNYSEALKYEDEDFRNYEKGNFNNYSSFTYAVYEVKSDSYLSGGTKDENGKVTYTDEQKQQALDAAKKDAEHLLNGKYESVEEFNNAISNLGINKDNEDAASTESKYIPYTQISNSDIQRWVGNVNRVSGDTTTFNITKTVTNEDQTTTLETTGFTVVLFIERDDNNTNLVDIRHILFKFEGGTTNESGETVYSDSEKNAAKEKAETMLETWKKGDATAESFGELANLNSADSTGTDGGLYENVYRHQMVDNFDAWCFDEARKAGDTGIVETEYGYHIIYFEKAQDISYRNYMIKNELVAEDTIEWRDALAEKQTITKVNLSGMDWEYTMN